MHLIAWAAALPALRHVRHSFSDGGSLGGGGSAARSALLLISSSSRERFWCRLRHKCSKLSYQIVFWVIVGVHVGAATDYVLHWRITRAVWGRVLPGSP